MSESNWTKEQLQAIEASGCNLLVAAAAGAGKTAVLVERIIRKITDIIRPIDIDRLLVVTFTNAAASEMRERIANAISDALEKKPESLVLQRQMTLLNKASIMTIHSFCLDVIRNNFHMTDLDPGFGIADETEAVMMKSEALLELFESKYEAEEPEEDFMHLVECYAGNRDDASLQNMVLEIYEFVQSCPWPEKWLKEKAGAFILPVGADFSETSWGSVLIAFAKKEVQDCVNILQKAENIALYSEGLNPYLTCIQYDLYMLRELLDDSCSVWDPLCYKFSTLKFQKLQKCGKDADKESQEKIKEIRDEVKKKIKKLTDEIFYSDSAHISQELLLVHPMIESLCKLVSQFSELYSAKKREKGLLDFNDLEHYCLEILTDAQDDSLDSIMPTEAAMNYRNRYDEILIDEYQDSNLVQEAIMKTVSKEQEGKPNLFMVGDVKQSIYRFRQAKPELFLEKYNTYPLMSGTDTRKILLFKNFRSRCEVVNAVNFIFRQIMTKAVGELDYTKDEELNLGAGYAPSFEEGLKTGGAAELHIINLGEEGGSFAQEQHELSEQAADDEDEGAKAEQEEDRPDKVQIEARVIASRIKELVEQKGSQAFSVFDKSTKRYKPTEYRDIVILLRSTKNWAGIISEELSKAGIPVFTDTGTGYFKTIEVQTIISLLQIIDNPVQDIPMLAVLKSPVGMFNVNELVDIRLSDKEAPIYEALKKMAADADSKLADKVAEFICKYEQWREKAYYMSTSELVWFLYESTGYYSFVGAMPGGLQRQANLRLLFERARKFEKTSYKGLFNFINFIDRLKSSQGDMGSAKVLGENENVVRLMSIHKSKGLEFPVVILAGTGKSFNLQDMNKAILLHQELGFGPDYVDSEKRISYPMIPKFAIKQKMKLESLSEEVRILYVALTRAREKLIITGSVKNIENAAKVWRSSYEAPKEKLPNYDILKSKGYLGWITSALIRHPDCNALRQAAGIDNDIPQLFSQDESTWHVQLWNKNEIPSGRQGIDQNNFDISGFMDKMVETKVSDEVYKDVAASLSWKYNYTELSGIPAKLSVTELKRRYNEALADEEQDSTDYSAPIIKKPLFLQEIKGLTSAEKGTALHFVMQHLDLGKVTLKADIIEQIQQMVMRDMLTVQQAEAVQVNKVLTFFQSSIGIRMRDSKRVYREVPFNIEVEAADIYKELSANLEEETLLVQGVIDCFFEEADGIVLIDYKTDYAAPEDISSIKDKYEIQVNLYAKALEKINGIKVKEKAVYLFWNGQIIRY